MKKKRRSSWIRENKVKVILVLVLAAILLSFFGTKIYLYLKLAVGNDIIVRLEVDQTELDLLYGEEKKITVVAKVTTNPFCRAVCHYRFSDLGRNTLLEEQDFNITPAAPFSKEYTIKAEQWGSGLELYRFDLDCYSISTFLCHTTEEPATRSVPVTVWYGPSAEQKMLREDLQQQLENYSSFAGELKAGFDVLAAAEKKLAEHAELDLDPSDLELEIDAFQNKLLKLEQAWPEQNLSFLERESALLSLEPLKDKFDEYRSELALLISSYNQQSIRLQGLRTVLLTLQAEDYPYPEQAEEIENLSQEYNHLAILFEQRLSLDAKENDLGLLEKKVDADLSKALVMEQELALAIDKDLLCALGGECLSHPNIDELASQENFDLDLACQEKNVFFDKMVLLNQSLMENSTNQSYPEEEKFWDGIREQISLIKINLTESYLSALSKNGTNTNIIKKILSTNSNNLSDSNINNNTNNTINNNINYSNYDLFPAIINVLLEQLPAACQITSVVPVTLSDFTPELIILEQNFSIQSLDFSIPSPQCCVLGRCEECCFTEECLADPGYYPVLFLHGHALSQGTSAEYSLEGFNDIQKRLEEDGYLNAGTITLYAAMDFPEKRWGLLPAPLTIRGSYYFDVFRQPDSHHIVYAKSENLDTYAVRLQELIQAIKYKTGRPKVNLVAFSMGGLVARRNLQIFGTEDVHQLVMIGTPNHGVSGRIAELCALTGAKLECRDLQADSLFINKLNYGRTPDIPVYNLVGTGCQMDDGSGDGAVLESSGLLSWADNHLIYGECRSAVQPLHLDLRNTHLYPETYLKLKEALDAGR